mmetsp:Transcript_2741/g.8330  ORF Transcript_2741/g.8330 Transcript_2741/m.8330 type:complete len:363 (+) Transcript_2741:58-1146(+)
MMEGAHEEGDGELDVEAPSLGLLSTDSFGAEWGVFDPNSAKWQLPMEHDDQEQFQSSLQGSPIGAKNSLDDENGYMMSEGFRLDMGFSEDRPEGAAVPDMDGENKAEDGGPKDEDVSFFDNGDESGDKADLQKLDFNGSGDLEAFLNGAKAEGEVEAKAAIEKPREEERALREEEILDVRGATEDSDKKVEPPRVTLEQSAPAPAAGEMKPVRIDESAGEFASYSNDVAPSMRPTPISDVEPSPKQEVHLNGHDPKTEKRTEGLDATKSEVSGHKVAESSQEEAPHGRSSPVPSNDAVVETPELRAEMYSGFAERLSQRGGLFNLRPAKSLKRPYEATIREMYVPSRVQRRITTSFSARSQR